MLAEVVEVAVVALAAAPLTRAAWLFQTVFLLRTLMFHYEQYTELRYTCAANTIVSLIQTLS
ncbi:hypothetical protein JZ751_001456 [Albula glossodonta]|uniref:Uncharacterized protein n=1 Tax=Albula glossodonta TaxID=121402 RepID=A0A8T2PTS2_9TELE|nr:hypothetical protein JZ751_001456 [Albula glossodonta]